MATLTEADIESLALDWLAALGWQTRHDLQLAPGGLFAERRDYQQVVLEERLRNAIAALNPDLPAEALEDAYRKVLNPEGATLEQRNRAFHRMLIEGVPVDYRTGSGERRGGRARIVDFDAPDNNDWLAVRQFTVMEDRHTRRPDLVLFVNGLPLVIIELKNPVDERATMWAAYNQLQTYKQEIPSLFVYNEALVISDGLEARIGTLTASRDRFMPWRTITGEKPEPPEKPQLEVLIKGVFEPSRFLQLLRDFIVFEDEGGGKLSKKMAGYHQFHAVNVAVKETLRAAAMRDALVAELSGLYEAGRQAGGNPGDRRIGVIWHTQGSGKSLTMVFYAARIARHPQMENPTIIVLTDRNDLDDQLFGVFSRCRELLRQAPIQAESRAHLRKLLEGWQSGGIIFTTIQKFLPDVGGGLVPAQNEPFTTIQESLPDVGVGLVPAQNEPITDQATPNKATPRGATTRVAPTGGGDPDSAWTGLASARKLSDRRNIVVIADEAHRSQYDFIDGFARHMRDALPNASFIGFTGTPLERDDRNTRAVFGDYISIYDIQRAVDDGATVPIYYESRLAKLNLPEELKPHIDEEFEEVTEGEELERKERLKAKWAQLEAVVGAPQRLEQIAQDIVNHFEQRLAVLAGKGMIVCMSRRICVALYDEIVRLRPEWHHDEDDKGVIKVVMTGSASDPPEWQPHIRNKQRREYLANRFRDPNDPLKLVIVRDMWLTGFDAPPLHTMYVDKPMRAHGLMQAIARVNRVFRDKPGGLVVDYIGLAYELKQALATYTESGGTGRAAIDQEEAVAVLKEKHEICCDLFHGFDWSAWKTGAPAARLALLPAAQEHILAQENGKERFVQAVSALCKAFALAVPHADALAIRDDVAFFQAVRAALMKRAPTEERPEEQLDYAIQQIISKAVASEGIVDMFAAAGLRNPDLAILSEEFLAEVRGMPHKNLAVEVMRKLLEGEIKVRQRKNLVQARSFAEMLEKTIRRYQNRAVEAAQVIEELIALAREMREADKRGEQLGLSDEELAFYDALQASGSVAQVLSEPTLKRIAQEIVQTVRRNITIDWARRENVRAHLRRLVKRILRKHGYPAEQYEQVAETVLEQAQLFADEWAAA